MLNFLKEYIFHPRSVGAILPSEKSLTAKMLEKIEFTTAKIIVEYGPGTGAFTSEIIKRKKEDTTLILIEQNKKFYQILKEKYQHIENLHIINDGAENACEIIKKYGFFQVDYIVSGLPFTSLPKEVSKNILNTTKKILGDGLFITFQYSKLKQKFFTNYFSISDILKVKKNIPPAYVFILKNYK